MIFHQTRSAEIPRSSLPAGLQRTERLDPLTGLRGVAAYAVLTAHAIDTAFFYGRVPIFHSFAARLAYFGMSLFFVLSGFVIHYNYAESFAREGLPAAGYKFFVARFARLYPLYIISLCVSAPHVPVPNFADHPGVLAAFLTLSQSWFNVEMAMFPPDWSVSTEWFFYLAFIPLAALARRINRPVLALAIYCLAAMPAVFFLLRLFSEPLTALVQHWLFLNDKVSAGAWGWIIYFAPPIRLLEFIGGMLAAKAYLALRQRPLPSGALTAALILAPLWCVAVIFAGRLTHPPFQNILSNIIFAPALAPLMLCVCLSRGLLSQALSSRPLVFMGEISYSVYVWSFFVLTMLAASFQSTVFSPEAFFNSILKVTVDIGITTAFAYGSFLLIESPARRWLRMVLSRSEREGPIQKTSSRA